MSDEIEQIDPAQSEDIMNMPTMQPSWALAVGAQYRHHEGVDEEVCIMEFVVRAPGPDGVPFVGIMPIFMQAELARSIGVVETTAKTETEATEAEDTTNPEQENDNGED